MKFTFVEYWDEELWHDVSEIYFQAFGKGCKSSKIIRNMFEKKLCSLHIGINNCKVISMALVGNLKGSNGLIIDYLAVQQNYRKQGIGQEMVEHIKRWALEYKQGDSLVIEVESENTHNNVMRIRFWEKCGFTLTGYTHRYVWVPEVYQAMYKTLIPHSRLPNKGEELFKLITSFHKESFKAKMEKS